MQTKQITLRGKDIFIGWGIGQEGIGRGNFVLEKENLKVRAFHLPNLAFDDTNKIITAEWMENLLTPTAEFKPLPEYFDNETKKLKDGVEELFIQNHKSESSGLVPNTAFYKYDGYGMKPTVNGDTMYGSVWRTCVDVFTELRYGVKCVNAAGQLIQPVTADVEYTDRHHTADLYNVVIMPVDGVAPFQFSKDGVTYDTTNTLTYDSPESNYAFIKDNEGTAIKITLDPTNWQYTVLP